MLFSTLSPEAAKVIGKNFKLIIQGARICLKTSRDLADVNLSIKIPFLASK